MNKIDLEKINKELTERKEQIGKVRDELSAYFDEIEALLADCNDAYESIEYAIEALSRLC